MGLWQGIEDRAADMMGSWRGWTRLAIAAEMIYGAGWLLWGLGELHLGSHWGWVGLANVCASFWGLSLRLQVRERRLRPDTEAI